MSNDRQNHKLESFGMSPCFLTPRNYVKIGARVDNKYIQISPFFCYCIRLATEMRSPNWRQFLFLNVFVFYALQNLFTAIFRMLGHSPKKKHSRTLVGTQKFQFPTINHFANRSISDLSSITMGRYIPRERKEVALQMSVLGVRDRSVGILVLANNRCGIFKRPFVSIIPGVVG